MTKQAQNVAIAGQYTNVIVIDLLSNCQILSDGKGTMNEAETVFSCGTFIKGNFPRLGVSYNIISEDTNGAFTVFPRVECVHSGSTSDFEVSHEGMPTSTNIEIVRNIFDAAAGSHEFFSRFASDPSATALEAGMIISQRGIGLEGREDFNQFVYEQAKPLLARIQEAHTNKTILTLQQLESELADVKCTLCKIGLYAVAAAIVAAGAVGLTALTVTTPIVLTVASTLGISVGSAVSFISSLVPVVAKGVGAVAEALCKKMNAC